MVHPYGCLVRTALQALGYGMAASKLKRAALQTLLKAGILPDFISAEAHSMQVFSIHSPRQ
jgi:hypothetical protein